MRSFACVLICAAFALGQNTVEMPWSANTGSLVNNHTDSRVVWRERVTVPGASSLQLTFDAVTLGVDSYLRTTSLADGAVQVLDAAGLERWQNHTAWFNGDRVEIELILASCESGRLVTTRLFAGFPPTFPDNICGSVDDRVPTTEARVCRVAPSATGNCGAQSTCAATAFLISNASWILTAQHVAVASAFGIAEFNTPPSLADGAIVHSIPNDQYPIDFGSVTTSPGGIVGDDWCVARLLANGAGQMPAPLQGWYNIATPAQAVAVPAGSQLRITGFGIDTDPGQGDRNQACQTTTGPLSSVTGTALAYMLDTQGGVSGSPVVDMASGLIIGIHTHGGCQILNPTSSNHGCSITNTGLQAALAGVCFAGIAPLNWSPTLVDGGVGVANTYAVTGGALGVGTWQFSPGPGWPAGITPSIFGSTGTTTSLQLTAGLGTTPGVYTGGQLIWTGTCNGSVGDQVAASITATVTTATPCTAALNTTTWAPTVALGGVGASQTFTIVPNGSTLTGGTWILNAGSWPSGLTGFVTSPNSTSTPVTVSATSTTAPGTYTGSLIWTGACNGSTATFGPVTISVDVVVPYPGTGEDFEMVTGVNSFPDSTPIKSAVPGDVITVTFYSLFGTFDGIPPIFGAQAYATAGPGLASLAGFPEVQLSLTDPGLFIVFDGSALNPIGPAVLQPGGMTFNFIYTGGFGGFTTRVQAFAVTAGASNGFFAATDAFEFIF